MWSYDFLGWCEQSDSLHPGLPQVFMARIPSQCILIAAECYRLTSAHSLGNLRRVVPFATIQLYRKMDRKRPWGSYVWTETSTQSKYADFFGNRAIVDTPGLPPMKGNVQYARNNWSLLPCLTLHFVPRCSAIGWWVPEWWTLFSSVVEKPTKISKSVLRPFLHVSKMTIRAVHRCSCHMLWPWREGSNGLIRRGLKTGAGSRQNRWWEWLLSFECTRPS